MFRPKVILILLACATILVGPSAFAGTGITDRHAPVTQVMLLPRFCWGQYLGYRQPQYNIPHSSCGAGMNHYCQGLIFLNMGERTFDNPGKKQALYQRAKRSFVYTLRWMKEFPYCPIRADVEASLRQANMGLMMITPGR